MATLFAGRYQLGELVGTGGMGEVWSALDTRLDREVALKLVPLRTLSANDRERIVREARSTARLRHPTIVTLFDAGEADGAMYLVMELVRGDTLADRLGGRALDPTEATRILAAVLDALEAAHAAGIVHRDIKPANVLLGPGGEVKLADFGIARQLDSVAADLTATGMHIGTPRYLAPEVFGGGSVATPASDVYSAGVMLFEMLTGRVPFDGTTAVATAMAHVNEPVPDPRAANPAVPGGLAAVAMRAMAKEPSQRFASPADMRRALVAAGTRGASGTVAPTEVMPARARASRRSGGRWWVVAALAAIAVGVVAAMAVLRGGDGDDVTTAPIGSTAPSVSAPEPAGQTGAVPPSLPAPTVPRQQVAVEPAGGAVAEESAPSSVDELVALLGADPEAYGSRTPALIDRLEKVGRGRKATDRAIELLAEADRWVANGELDPAVLDLLGSVLAPIADGPGNGNGRR